MDLKELDVLLAESGLLSFVEKGAIWNDDPAFAKFTAKFSENIKNGDGLFSNLGSTGVAFNPVVAIKKTVYEAFERISQSYFTFKSLIYDSYTNISKKNSSLSPKKFCYLTDNQLREKNFEIFSFDDDEKFYWTDCQDLFSQQKYYIPAQLIFCPYKYAKNEKTICLPISTGTALGCSREEAIFKGICEVVERDAFITNYLLSIPPRKIIYKSVTSKLKKYLSKFSKYRLKIYSFLLDSDIKIPTVLTLILDNHITAPAVSVGLKTELNLENAVTGSIEEAMQVRSWIRRCLLLQNFRGESYSERVTLRRALFWSNPDNTHLLDFILKTKNKFVLTSKLLSKHKNSDYSNKLALAKRILKDKGLGAYWKEITHPYLKNKKVYVTKTLIPSLQPHFMDEEFPYYGGKRLEALKHKFGNKINLIPHPFL
jgi:ribosomal protein S12 methylthiotransferase accessory factor